MTTFNNIPTHIITGFLGAGKTTVIQHLLQQKPAHERWAVIVNEFGQVGVDAALLKSDEMAIDAVTIKDIPGGCLCCVGSQALSVGLNQIIRQVKPQRIIIEPTGLGHPKKLIESLTGEFYQSVLDLKAVINCLDARHLSDIRYTEHETFVDQSNLADVLVATKRDTYRQEDEYRFYDYAAAFHPAKQKVAMIEHGQIPLAWLDAERAAHHIPAFPDAHSQPSTHPQRSSSQQALSQEAPKAQDWLMIEGHGNGFSSVGWRLGAQVEFNYECLHALIQALFELNEVVRVKGVVLSDRGWLSINATVIPDNIPGNIPQQTLAVLPDVRDSAVFEVISAGPVDGTRLNSRLKRCLHIAS